ncbi:helix-turn-helix domain-containing protein [Algoriphagus alkaliphilus]|jgi:predicted DNA-binding transcriptional regulator AlpA|nr:helix-turn-helix domain-containing protein [Algoriphagus alkaliphilus]|tara:strand:+ start:541 stop:744 length:204 start_codon:yes stop_codon:yes gene_type:complete
MTRNFQDDPQNQLMDRKTAAKYLGISPNTMAVWDCTKRYDLKPLKVGRAVRYRKSDLDAFMQRNLQS